MYHHMLFKTQHVQGNVWLSFFHQYFYCFELLKYIPQLKDAPVLLRLSISSCIIILPQALSGEVSAVQDPPEQYQFQP